jgi:hypothetical protein
MSGRHHPAGGARGPQSSSRDADKPHSAQPVAQMLDSKAMDYLIECSRSAREELLLRVAHRDSYLNVHFLVQGVLLALSQGVKIAGVETSVPLPFSLHLALPLTLVFALLYYTEDRLIGQLSSYVGNLSRQAREDSVRTIQSWDVSPQLREYARTAVWYRFWAHLAAFVIAPCVLLSVLYYSHLSGSSFEWICGVVQAAMLAVLLALSIRELRYRLKTGEEWKDKAEANAVANAGSAAPPSNAEGT